MFPTDCPFTVFKGTASMSLEKLAMTINPHLKALWLKGSCITSVDTTPHGLTGFGHATYGVLIRK